MKKYFYSVSLLLLLLACNAQNGTQEAASTAKAVPQGIQDVDVATFKAKMENDNVVLLDVRTGPEVAAGKIEGALEINVLEDDFQAKVDALDKDKTYLVYCKAGSRSAKACKIMEEAGFKDLYNLKGGFTAWQAGEK